MGWLVAQVLRLAAVEAASDGEPKEEPTPTLGGCPCATCVLQVTADEIERS